MSRILFDCGYGVVDAMLERGIATVDRAFVTHGHFDHVEGYDRLVATVRRDANPLAGAGKLPVHATTEAWATGILRSTPWLAGGVGFQDLYAGGVLTPVDETVLNLGIGCTVTPVPVYHGPFAYQPVIYVLQFRTAGKRHKLILAWDLLHLVTEHRGHSATGEALAGSHGYPGDEEFPVTASYDAYAGLPHQDKLRDGEMLPEHQILAREPGEHCELFISCNSLTPSPGTGHQSFEAALNLIGRVNPDRTWLTHYSGHDDPWGPLTPEQLAEWMAMRAQQIGHGHRDIRLAKSDTVINFSAL